MAKKYDAGVKEYRDTYFTPDYAQILIYLHVLNAQVRKVYLKKKLQQLLRLNHLQVHGQQFGQNYLQILNSTKAAVTALKMSLVTRMPSMHLLLIPQIFLKKDL